jgi:EmrB/QacA subfamily drug resistance transporter
MIVLDSTIVNVALTSIRADLHLSSRSLAWVVNGYMIPYGGFLLLGGRLGDYYGRRFLFMAGVALFAAASLLCGLAGSAVILVTGRIIQGLGAAVVLAVALSLILRQFQDAAERTKAIGVFSFACACGGSAGLLLGGVLTASLGWRWIFLVNVPIAAAVCVLCWALTSVDEDAHAESGLNSPGAVAVTGALLLAAYGIARVSESGWGSDEVLIPMLGALCLLCCFSWIEWRARQPLIPRGLLNNRYFPPALLAGVLWAAAQAMWFYLSSLYLQDVLRFDALEVGLTFLPFSLMIGVLSCGVSTSLIERFGVRLPFCTGVLCCVVGLLSFSRLPGMASVWVDLMPGIVLVGIGSGVAYNPLVLGAVRGLGEAEYGAASGVLNSCFAMGSALSIAFFSSFGGYQASFRVGAALAGTAAVLGVTLPRGAARG